MTGGNKAFFLKDIKMSEGPHAGRKKSGTEMSAPDF
jgi:hypothetical protein